MRIHQNFYVVLFRAKIKGNRICEDILTTITNLVRSGRLSITVNFITLRANQDCVVEVDSVDTQFPQCSPAITATVIPEQLSIGQSVGGAVGGILVVLLILIIITAVICIRRKKKPKRYDFACPSKPVYHCTNNPLDLLKPDRLWSPFWSPYFKW